MISLGINVAEMIGRNSLARSTRAVNTSLERLATGKRINRGSDDPAGLTAASSLKAEERSIMAKIDALAQEQGYLGAREGAQSVVSDLLVDLSGLVVTAANRGATSQAEREAMQIEANSIVQTINHLANTSRFKDEQILTGYTANYLGQGTATRTLEDGTVETYTYSLADLGAGGELNLVDGDSEAAQNAVDAAAEFVASSRATVGIREKDIDSEVRALQSQLENTSAARSQIEDTDYAKEAATLVRNQVLQQASLFVTALAQEQLRMLTASLLRNPEASKK